ncbi:hypothetical protein [Paenibacillus bouchesdurhonensis]|uniref:hypothetical protein n=1 Tax=Paenibacillus bouchesdurhonensis TaxID=1870990 RepID=UPI001F444E99|nr:hypothetical protein [Paenibacillus bouchesdurhonensis]
MDIAAIVGLVAAISGVILGWTGRSRQIRKEGRSDGSGEGALRQDVEYIKRGVDDIKVDMRIQNQRRTEYLSASHGWKSRPSKHTSGLTGWKNNILKGRKQDERF